MQQKVIEEQDLIFQIINKTGLSHKKLSGFIIAVALVLGGLAVMRFGIFQIRKFKKGETRVTKKVSEQIAFLIFFVIILGLIVYSVNDLLFR